MSAEPDGLMTPDELGKIYKVTGRTIRQWHQDGIIPSEVNQGKILRFDPDEVAAVLKKNARKKSKQAGRLSLI